MEDKAFDTINVIPFIDVMLVLLVIVLTTSTFIARGAIPVDLPQASSGRTEMLKAKTVEIDRSGTVFLNGLPVEMSGLIAGLEEVSRGTPVLIRADRSIALQNFVQVMDAIKSAGFRHVSLQTEERP
jgi:biopolymer transport protein ExbD